MKKLYMMLTMSLAAFTLCAQTSVYKDEIGYNLSNNDGKYTALCVGPSPGYEPESVNIPSTVTWINPMDSTKRQNYTVVEIASNAFSSKQKLTTVSMPMDVVKVGASAFQRSEALRSISWGGAHLVPSGCFYGCKSLTNFFAGAVTKIGDMAFAESGISSFGWQGVEEIGARAFANCDNLTQVNFTPSIKKIGQQAFESCSQLTLVSFANSSGSVRLEGHVFNDTPIATLVLGSSIICNDQLGPFFNLEKLTTVRTGHLFEGIYYDSGTRADRKIFSGCNAIANVICESTTPPDAENLFEPETLGKALLTVPAGSIEAYRNAPVWGEFHQIVEETAGISDVPGESHISINGLEICSDNESSDICAFDSDGRIAAKGRGEIHLPCGGIYLIHCGERTFKVAL